MRKKKKKKKKKKKADPCIDRAERKTRRGSEREEEKRAKEEGERRGAPLANPSRGYPLVHPYILVGGTHTHTHTRFQCSHRGGGVLERSRGVEGVKPATNKSIFPSGAIEDTSRRRQMARVPCLASCSSLCAG